MKPPLWLIVCFGMALTAAGIWTIVWWMDLREKKDHEDCCEPKEGSWN